MSIGPLAALLLLLVLLADASPSTPTVEPLDRVVAVIGDRPLFLSELRARARPHFVRLNLTGSATPAAKAALLRTMLDRMIDEHLEAREADAARVGVSPAEVDEAIKLVAAQMSATPSDVFAEAKRQGLSEEAYRDEIRRQVLEGKLVQLRVRGRVQIGEPEARAAYASWVKEQSGPDAPVELRTIVLKTTPETKKAKEALAARIVTEAKAGADFCGLVKKHSQDAATASTCGSRGPMARSLLFPDVAKATATLEPGKVTGPIPLRDPSGEALLVIQRAPGKATIPTFDSVKDKMRERAFVEAIDRERQKWLQELRKATFVEVKP